MTEKYLHFLWNNKRLPLHQLTTVDGKSLQVVHVGTLNTDSGPDFFNGTIVLDGLTLTGNIEMHLLSSDWNLHGHQFDPAYRNVILHVVYKHDELIFIEGIPIPTVELQAHIDWKHYAQFEQLLKNNLQIPCERLIHQIPSPIIWHQVQQALFNRLERKSNAFSHSGNDIAKVLFQFITKGFGLKTNELPFEELANRIPIQKFIRASKHAKLALVFGTGGFLDHEMPDAYSRKLKQEWDFQKHRLNIQAGRVESWKFKGCRPNGFPTLRLAQFATFAHEFDWSSAFWELPVSELKGYLLQKLVIEPDSYWKTHLSFGKEKTKKNSGSISQATAVSIIINSVVPFLWWLGAHYEAPIYREKAVELLESFPAEKPAKLDFWKDFGVIPKSAADSQGLLELQDQFCLRKKCLACEVGQAIFQ